MSDDTHSFITPAPAGLAALAVACFGFGAVFLGQVQLGGLPLLAAWLVGGGIVQFTVAVIELKDKNMTGGNVFLFFSAFFMFGAAISTFLKFLMLTGQFGDVQPHAIIEGYCWMAGAAFLTFVTPSYLKAPIPMFLIVLLVDVVLWIIVLLDLGLAGAQFKPVVGYLLFAAGWIALYMAGAVVNNHIMGRKIFPTFGSIL
ncbi:GPR1/FUN34/YaaH family transporter [Hirschia litorea]|uniref:GPR1/FUN34/YaaH family transporter n=1 Tax=Hirschia litorea TaxID=1199156 RepID=A0ABW2IP33_9PROT